MIRSAVATSVAAVLACVAGPGTPAAAQPAAAATAAAATAGAGTAATPATAAAAAPSPARDRRSWRFVARLDDKTIGEHRFVVQTQGPAAGVTHREVHSDARFDVRFLGITAYRYRHQVRETWRDDCLMSLAATTDDDGRRTAVEGRAVDGGFEVATTRPDDADAADASNRSGASAPATAASRATGDGCLMSFAYWNPALATRHRLLDPGTGRIEAVTIEPIASHRIPVRGTPTPVRGLRIRGLPQPIEVWYAGTEWVGLDTVVAGGRRLAYRLE